MVGGEEFLDEVEAHQRTLGLRILAAIEDHMGTVGETDSHAGVMIGAVNAFESTYQSTHTELTDPTSPLFVTTESQPQPPVHVFMSYPAALFKDSAFHVVPVSNDTKCVEVVSFEAYDSVYETTARVLEKELLAVHRPKIILVMGKDTHSAKLAEEFGLEYLNASTLALDDVDDESGSVGGESTGGVVGLLHRAVQTSTNTRGIIIDGFPNTVAEATLFETMAGPVSAVLNFNSTFVTNNSVEAIKKRLFGVKQDFTPVEKPIIKYFGDRVIPIRGVSAGDTGEEQVYQEAFSK
ncbi:hypothetical protein HDU98_008379, partial [Podochytrium sp. JEL0797]